MKLNKPKFWDNPGISFWTIILYPLSVLYANTFATLKILQELKNKGTTMKLKNNLVPFDQFNDIVELSKYNKLEKKYSK